MADNWVFYACAHRGDAVARVAAVRGDGGGGLGDGDGGGKGGG